jgi:hypothetical protein
MRNIAIAMMLTLGVTLNAQVNQNVTKVSKTTTTTVNDGTAPKKLVKTENREARQNIELKDAESNQLNKEIQATPVEVTSSTSVSADPGFNQKIGQITNYQYNGRDYAFVTDKTGYRIASPDNKDYGLLRRTSNNNYIYKTKDRTSIGYFVETYDDKSDGVTVETYTKKQ